MEACKNEVLRYLEAQKFRHELHTFERAYMIDIWKDSIFICIQICEAYIGFSVSYDDDPMGLDSRPETTFNSIAELMADLQLILTSPPHIPE